MTRDVMIDNQGTNDVFIRTGGDNTLTSTLNSFRIPAGQYRIFEKGTTNGVANTYIAYITSTGTSNIKVYIGEG